MILTFKTYLDLMIALKKHFQDKGVDQANDPSVRQGLIYKHFIRKYGSFIAVNREGDKKLFWNHPEGKTNKASKKEFKKFMNVKQEDYANRSKSKGETQY